MRVDTFSFELPNERIAQHPTDDREAARLMEVPLEGPPLHHRVGDLPSLLPEGALLVVNDTRVIPARLHGHKADTGGKVEIFLVRKTGEAPLEIRQGVLRGVEIWRALGKSSKALRFGSDVTIGPMTARLLGRADDGLLEVALWLTDEPDAAPGAIREAINANGAVPLPPYIKRDAAGADAERYQTVFARVDGAVAAPTAGLHLTRALIGRLAVKGCELATVTLHVGLGTFQPVTVEDLDAHPMHAETFSLSQTTADAINEAKREGRPVVAVGTTVVRALESAARFGAEEGDGSLLRARSGETRLLIQPGYGFKVVDALVTNFHLPRSTLLAMVCAFAGTERVLGAYRTAVDEAYRFYSYGDAMLLRRDPAAGPGATTGAPS